MGGSSPPLPLPDQQQWLPNFLPQPGYGMPMPMNPYMQMQLQMQMQMMQMGMMPQQNQFVPNSPPSPPSLAFSQPRSSLSSNLGPQRNHKR